MSHVYDASGSGLASTVGPNDPPRAAGRDPAPLAPVRRTRGRQRRAVVTCSSIDLKGLESHPKVCNYCNRAERTSLWFVGILFSYRYRYIAIAGYR